MRAAYGCSAGHLAVAFALTRCTLNPQPLPPEQFDGSNGANADAAIASGSDDGGAPKDAAFNKPPPRREAGLDSSEEVYSDAGLDSTPDDGPVESGLDAPSDATPEGGQDTGLYDAPGDGLTETGNGGER